MSSSQVVLHELDADEWFNVYVYRHFRPETTRAEFMIEWLKFQQAKAEHKNQKSAQ